MRALILVAGAALAVAACSSNDNANNTMNVDENLTTTDMNATDMNAHGHERDGRQHVHERGHEREERATSNATANTSTNNAM